jgi:hypothetical protein
MRGLLKKGAARNPRGIRVAYGAAALVAEMTMLSALHIFKEIKS